ncbi:unnamed protein product [Prorocentrum cordatum]|uniref:Uncharacterized protein n=1 Tax=Prorocentrum cordatum TaxID=2364126 RepID=A0ABN9ULK4_9DINO|nr:unnamed protein product [Polarella glacialis]
MGPDLSLAGVRGVHFGATDVLVRRACLLSLGARGPRASTRRESLGIERRGREVQKAWSRASWSLVFLPFPVGPFGHGQCAAATPALCVFLLRVDMQHPC